MKGGLYTTLLVLFTVLFGTRSFSQTVVKGVVRDANTKQPIQSVSVYFKGGKGVSTNEDGSYVLTTYNTNLATVIFSYVGYKPVSKSIKPFEENTLDIDLQLAGTKNEVVVKAKRGKYSNKNNPAVELIRKVIDNKDKNRVTAYDYVSYKQYEKIGLMLTKTPEKLMNNKLLKNWKFIFQNTDTTKIQGRAMLPVYLDETLSDKYYRKSPEKSKQYILAEKKVNFGDYLDVGGISSYLNRLYEDIDIYENNINLLATQFISPISDLAPTFYRFYLGDTTEIEGVKLVKLSFTPKNPTDLLFRGAMFITLDGNYSVQKLNMGVSKHANLNWVREMKINQDFAKGPDGRYHTIMSNSIIEFVITKSAQNSIVGERTVTFQNFKINEPGPDSVYKGDAIMRLNEKMGYVNDKNESYWQTYRNPPLTEAEAKVYSNIDSLTHLKSFRTFMDIATLLLAGYKRFGPYEVGPVNAFYSFNPVEGFRARLGGRTTPQFSRNIYLENYVAYGFKDEKWKYFGSVSYSFNKSSVWAYPLNYARVSFQRDTKIPGQELSFVVEDNFLLSFKRGKNDKWLYNDIWKAEYEREFGKDFAYNIAYKNWKQTPAGAITYLKTAGQDSTYVHDLTTSEVSAEVRWSPHMQFYQGKQFRIPIINKYPIFKLRYIAGIKGLAGGQYTYHNLNLTIEKRFYLSQLGFTDMFFEGGYIFGQVPYPLMTIHRANQTYSYQIYSYNLMNFLEFVSDHSASLLIDHKFNGFLFNKIPLFKKLKWREAISGRLLWGGVRKENDPKFNPTTFKFPVDPATGIPSTYTLNSGPYVEVSAGIMNVFKVMRIDLVKRLTYLDHPDVTSWGIRSRVRIDF